MTSEEEIEMDIDVEAINDSLVPFYLRDSPTFKAYVRQERRREMGETLDKLTGKAPVVVSKPAVPKWHVQSRELMTWRDNHNDQRSIYSIGDDQVLVDGCSTQSVGSDIDSAVSKDNMDLRREREYIYSSQKNYSAPVRRTGKHILVHALKEYNKPATHSSVGSYGSPRNCLEMNHRTPKKIDVHTVHITRISSGALRLTQSRGGSPCKQYRQGSKSEFCDVLGSVACQKCIEMVNRKMASEVQSKANPVDMTTSKLVSPNLIKLMNTPCRFSTTDTNTLVETRRSVTSLSGAMALRKGVLAHTKLPKLILGDHVIPARTSCPMKSMDGFLAGKAFQSAKRGKDYGRRGALVFSARS